MRESEESPDTAAKTARRRWDLIVCQYLNGAATQAVLPEL